MEFDAIFLGGGAKILTLLSFSNPRNSCAITTEFSGFLRFSPISSLLFSDSGGLIVGVLPVSDSGGLIIRVLPISDSGGHVVGLLRRVVRKGRRNLRKNVGRRGGNSFNLKPMEHAIVVLKKKKKGAGEQIMCLLHISTVDLSVLIFCACSVFPTNRDTMWTDLIQHGIMNDYDPWEHHEEDRKQGEDSDAVTNSNECPKCGSSRWKDASHEQADNDSEEDERSHAVKKIPQLVIRHFPVKPRLQRIFMSPNYARDMRWHKVSRLDDDTLSEFRSSVSFGKKDGKRKRGDRYLIKQWKKGSSLMAIGFILKGDKEEEKHKIVGWLLKDDDNGCRDYYGLLEEVVVLEYDHVNNDRIPKVVLFKCKWFDVYDETRGIKKDKFGTVLVNISNRLQTNEPFTLAAQVLQVFYVHSHIESESDWRIVIKTNTRHYFDIPNGADIIMLMTNLFLGLSKMRYRALKR
ncbi:hypothetical protein V2J09_011111 [Rumex salicifolius]